jgi:ribose 5-phosphate isomerase B
MASENEIRAVVRRVVEELGRGSDGPDLRPPGTASGSQAGSSVAIGADHGGYALKERLAAHLRDQGVTVDDCGAHSPEAVDYPDIAHAVAKRVASGASRWGVIIDGAGIGSCMAANKVPGIRAALCYDVSSARNSREHNHANVLTLGAGLIGEGLARQILDTWLATDWGRGRHARRVELITDVEQRYSRSAARGS